MKKLLFCALSLTLILALAGWATETRVFTLGNANNILKDDANILLYPSTINLYRALVLSEVDGSGLYKVGAHYDFGEGKGVVGLYIDKTRLGLSWGAAQPDPFDTGGIDNRLNLFYGRPFGETLFGMALSLYSNSYKSETSGDNSEESNFDLGLQLGLTLQEKLDLTAGFGYGSWTYKDGAGDDVTKPKSNISLNLGGRYWYAYSDEVDFIPHLGFSMFTGGYTDEATTDEYKENDFMVDLGWGVNIRPVDRVLLLFDLGISYDNGKYTATVEGTDTETKTTMMNLPYYKIALEGHVTKWWDVRLGAEKYWHSHKVTDVKTEGYAMTDTYLGSGFHFGNLTLDAWLNPDFVLNGPNFVSGWQGDVAYMASIKYAWK